MRSILIAAAALAAATLPASPALADDPGYGRTGAEVRLAYLGDDDRRGWRG